MIKVAKEGKTLEINEKALSYAKSKGWQVVPELQSTEVIAEKLEPRGFTFDINRSANVVIKALEGLSKLQLELVLEMENQRPKPRKSVINAIEKNG